jgi:hypothetical protein
LTMSWNYTDGSKKGRPPLRRQAESRDKEDKLLGAAARRRRNPRCSNRRSSRLANGKDHSEAGDSCTRCKGAEMKLSDGEKLILVMLSEIHQNFGIKDGIDPKFV